MILPQPDQFPSRPTPDGRGRVYAVHKRTELVAYFIDDTATLRAAGADAGFFLYAFIERRRVGVWNWTTDADRIIQAMETFRTACEPDAPRPVPRAPDGEPAMIHPKFNRVVEDLLGQRGDDL